MPQALPAWWTRDTQSDSQFWITTWGWGFASSVSFMLAPILSTARAACASQLVRTNMMNPKAEVHVSPVYNLCNSKIVSICDRNCSSGTINMLTLMPTKQAGITFWFPRIESKIYISQIINKYELEICMQASIKAKWTDSERGHTPSKHQKHLCHHSLILHKKWAALPQPFQSTKIQWSWGQPPFSDGPYPCKAFVSDTNPRVSHI